MSDVMVDLQNVRMHFGISRGSIIARQVGTVRAVDGISLQVAQGETLGLVGESGCGKSTLGRVILQLLRPTSGRVIVEGRELQSLPERELRPLRPHMQMIFQDPYASLDPRMTVYDSLAEPLLAHQIVPRSELYQEILRLMDIVGLAPRFMKKYPHEFSGGQRQRIAIARALALRPRLIIADEPVSALDVSIQSQILNLLADLRREFNLTLIFISHDLSVVRHIADRVAVMYLGRIVELASAEAVFAHPAHPYTRALISAIPIPDPLRERSRQRIILEGDPPSPVDPPAGCRFHPRCAFAVDACRSGEIELAPLDEGHETSCIRAAEI